MEIIERLKEYVKKNNLTQHQLCRELNGQGVTVNRWLLGKSKPSYAWRNILEKFLTEKGY